MKVYYTIGEISKLSNVSIKKIRYYDEIGLLKPVYVNKESKYRYYSFNQLITIDLIKQFRMMGFSLETIKTILNSDTSIKDISENIKQQSIIIEQNIKQLIKMQAYLHDLNENIINSMNEGLDKIFVRHHEERLFINYSMNANNIVELDVKMREILLDLEQNNNDNLCMTLGSTVAYNDLKENNKIIYTGFKIFNDHHRDKNISYLPKGDYLTLIYEGDIRESRSYYEKMMNYIHEHNLEVIGDFNETWIISRIDENLQEQSLIKIDILIK